MRSSWLFAGAIAAVLSGTSTDVFALGADDAYQVSQRSLSNLERQVPGIRTAMAGASTQQRTPEQRLADGDLLLRNKDYERAAVVFNELIERPGANQTVYAEGLLLLGETYYRSRQYRSARRVYDKMVKESSSNARLAPHEATALARLVDIAIRIRDLGALDGLFAKMSQSPPAGMEGVLSYARGRALVVKKDYAGARQALSSVADASQYGHQSKYLLGVVALKEAQAKGPAGGDAKPVTIEDARARRGQYAAAIEAFRLVTQLPPDTPDHKHTIDLAWLAIGRLHYETDQWAAAAEAYNHVDRSSPEFGTMLYELASVYVRLGDAQRAQRALEVLAIADPDSSDIAEASLLRGDLQLKTGQFKKALESYEAVRARYEPMRGKVDGFLASTNDPAVYYDKLSREQLEITDDRTDLPPLAIQWAREAENGPEAFGVLDDVVTTRNLVRQAQSLVERLSAILGATNRVRAFPELRAGEQRAVSVLNGTARARATVADGLDDVEDSELSGELATVRRERRQLQPRITGLPVSEADFQKRDEASTQEWNRVSQKVQQLNLQVDTLQAIVNALHRVLKESASEGVVRDPVSVRRFQDELTANERDLELYRRRVTEMRRGVDGSRLGAGFGDQTFAEEAQVRTRFNELVLREVQLVAGGAAGSKAAGYAGRVTPLVSQANRVDADVESIRADIAKQVELASHDVVETVQGENAKILDYGVRLDQLDQEARLAVGQVAMRNFGLVRDRLKSVVLRADVGVTEQAWEVREEQVGRVRNLQSERARSERLLDEELREVMDDTGEDAEGTGK